MENARDLSGGSALVDSRACVLAGGLGLRLRSIVEDVPKVLAPVAGRPFLDYILRQLVDQGIRRVTLCTGYRSDAVESFAGTGARWGMELSYSAESKPLGTAGAIAAAWRSLNDERLLVVNGDSYFDVPLDVLWAQHEASGATATIAVRRTTDAARYGTVEIGRDGVVTAFREKGADASGWMNGGIYVLQRAALDGIDPNESASLEQDVFPRLAAGSDRAGGRTLHAVPFEGRFIDIGVPADYRRADQVMAEVAAVEGGPV
jgi:D-glycero-alpha-D-manno-heptose 1-phosphate guanylyltransferase